MPKVSGLSKSLIKHMEGHLGSIKDKYLAMTKPERKALLKELKASGDPEQKLLAKLLEAIYKPQVHHTPSTPVSTSGSC